MNDNAAAAAGRSLGLMSLFSLVLLWNSSYKGARVLNTLYAIDLGATPFHIGLLLATYGLFPLVLAVHAGRVSDRYGTRAPILTGLLLTATGILLPCAWPSFPAIFISAAVSGTGFIFVQVGLQTLTGSLAAGEGRTRNINIYALTVSTADLIGPVLAGFAIDYAGHVRTYIVLAVPAFVALAALYPLSRRFPGADPNRGGKTHGSTADLFRVPDLRRVFIASAVVMTGLDLFQLYMPLYGHRIGLSASAIGLVLGAFAAAAFVTRALMPFLVRSYGEEKTLRYSIVVGAATFVLVPLVQNGFALGAICFVLGLGMGLGQPLGILLAYNYSPSGRAGEAMGLRIAINNSMHVVVPTLFGALGSVAGVAPVFWLTSALLGAGAYASRKRAT